MFDRCVVISLARRPDRLAGFRSRVPADWPFAPIETVLGVDGRHVKPPAWWKQGAGAWGCYRSHARILEDALNQGHKRILIFEDDATFCPDFSRLAREYLEALPDGWLQAYLGGQHLRRPREVEHRPAVLAAGNVNRTHAYAAQGEGIKTLYRWINATDQWVNRNHIDHHYGRLHKNAEAGYYAPANWLCGQAEGTSDIAWKKTPDRWWQRTREPAPAQAPPEGQFVAVVGLHRSGSSALAMMLHKLGVSMGDRLAGYEDGNGGGGEAVGLAEICEWAARFPTPRVTVGREALAGRLRKWVNARLKGREIAGGKYPHLCAFGMELMEATGERLRVVVADRPLEESIESLKRRSRKLKGWLGITDDQAEAVQRWLWSEREKFLALVPEGQVLRLPWDATQDDPAAAVEALVAFLGISPTPAQVEAAVAHVKRPQEAAA